MKGKLSHHPEKAVFGQHILFENYSKDSWIRFLSYDEKKRELMIFDEFQNVSRLFYMPQGLDDVEIILDANPLTINDI